MTTVGYGDIFPVTPGGRIFTIIACICGSFMLSLIMAKLTDMITLDGDQQSAYDEILNEKKREKTNQVKIGLVKLCCEYWIYKRRARLGLIPPMLALNKRIMIYRYVAKIKYQNE